MPTRPPPPLRLRLPAELAAVERARSAVLQHLAPLALDRRARYAVELVIEETVTNIASHAYRGERGHEFALEVEVTDDELVLRFEDAGLPFDPREVPSARPPATLDELEPGGLGLVLLRRYARHLAYERRDGCNRLAVTMARGGPARHDSAD